MPETPVLLLHGLGRHRRSMNAMGRALARHGYAPDNIGYASTCHPIEHLADTVVRPAVDRWLEAGAERIHFVTHSLGGILVRAEAARRFDAGTPLPDGCRAVMLAPPHAGSEVADALRDTWPVSTWCGPALRELGTGTDSVPRTLGSIRGIEVGVMIGTRRIVPFDRFFEGDNDGNVSVASAFAPTGLRDTQVVRPSHAFVMRDREVIRQTLYFLDHGRFPPTRPVPSARFP